MRFYPAPDPSTEEVEELTERLRRRILRRMKGAVPEAAILDMLALPHSGFSLDASVRIEAHDREAKGCQLEGFEDDGRHSWPRGSGVDWPA